MKKVALAAVALGTILSAVSGAAHADAPEGPSGFLCGFTSSDDPTGTLANPGTQVGEMDGGPVYLTDTPVNFNGVLLDLTDPTNPQVQDPTVWASPDPGDVTDNPVSGTLYCGIQVGGTGLYTDADATSASGSGTGAIYVPPTLISYQATSSDPVYVVTEAIVQAANNGASAHYYYDYDSGDWMTDPSLAHGSLAISQEVPPQEVCDLAPDACALLP